MGLERIPECKFKIIWQHCLEILYIYVPGLLGYFKSQRGKTVAQTWKYQLQHVWNSTEISEIPSWPVPTLFYVPSGQHCHSIIEWHPLIGAGRLKQGGNGPIDQRARLRDFDVTLFFVSFEHLSIPVMCCSNALRPQSRPWPLAFTKLHHAQLHRDGKSANIQIRGDIIRGHATCIRTISGQGIPYWDSLGLFTRAEFGQEHALAMLYSARSGQQVAPKNKMMRPG